MGLSDDDNMFMWELLIVGPADTVSYHVSFVCLSYVLA